jgi:hypothetical protein
VDPWPQTVAKRSRADVPRSHPTDTRITTRYSASNWLEVILPNHVCMIITKKNITMCV